MINKNFLIPIIVVLIVFVGIIEYFVLQKPEQHIGKFGNEILNIKQGLPEAWQYRIIIEKGEIGSPHGLEDPIARVDFINALDKAGFEDNKERLSLKIYFYDIAKKQNIMEIIEKEAIHSWCIPTYFDETKKYIIVTSPCYVNKGVPEDEEAKNFYYIFEQSLKKYFDKFK